MKKFLDENFLLETKTAQRLYHEFAKSMPIIDYHCHLPPDQIAEDINFENLTQIWLYGDHYKWRAMRTNGIDEIFCTGNATDYKNLSSGRRPCLIPYATHSITGRIWNCSAISTCMIYYLPLLQKSI